MASDKLHWIECNNCPTAINLSVTECGHLYCLNCIERLKSCNNKCLVCKKPTSYHAFDDSMPEIMKNYFKPINLNSIVELVNSVQRVEKFHKTQNKLFTRNAALREHVLKKKLNVAHDKIQELFKDLSIANERIKQSTSTSMMTSTPFERNNTPYRPHTRPTPIRPVTPTPFITPTPSSCSIERHRNINQQNIRQMSTPSANKRSTMLMSQPGNSNNQGPLFNSTNTMINSSQFKPSSKMELPTKIARPSPALMSYRKLVQERGNSAMSSSFQTFALQTSPSMQMKYDNLKSNLNYKIYPASTYSSIPRKRPNFMI